MMIFINDPGAGHWVMQISWKLGRFWSEKKPNSMLKLQTRPGFVRISNYQKTVMLMSFTN